jgi:site-specific recombinase XerD
MEVVMLERYFLKPQTVDRIRSNWLGSAIEHYVEWLEQEGYAVRNVYRRVPLLCHFGQFAVAHGAQTLEQAATLVEDFARHWLSEHGRADASVDARMKIAEEARNPVNQMLKLVLPEYHGGGRHPHPEPFMEEAPGFFAYLREERGLKETSVEHYQHYLNRFTAFLARQDVTSLKELSTAILATFVVESAPELSPNSRRNLCATLKVFLRYCQRERILAHDLSPAVEMPQAYRLAELPRSITWDEVRRMFAVVDRRTVCGRRDYAILLLLVTYGLRAHEVAALTLDDIDWQRDRLQVPERKAGHWTVYPLAKVVGTAILEYLQHGRPQTEDRHLFFRTLAPRLPLRSSTISQSAGFYLRKAGITVRRAGSHTLRHTCVQRLVDAEFSLKAIGDYVGHRSPSSTEIYAKVATEALREVALGDGEAL